MVRLRYMVSQGSCLFGYPKSLSLVGRIRCRFPDNDPGARELSRFIRKEAVSGQDPFFLIGRHGVAAVAGVEVKLEPGILDAMVTDCQFRTIRTNVFRWNTVAETSISICFTRGETFPISRFPRLLTSEAHSQSMRTFRLYYAGTNLLSAERKSLTGSNSFLLASTRVRRRTAMSR